MKFYVLCNDSLFFHSRDVYLCEWDSDLRSSVQWLIASGVSATKWGADIWVKNKIYEHLLINGCITYGGDCAL